MNPDPSQPFDPCLGSASVSPDIYNELDSDEDMLLEKLLAVFAGVQIPLDRARAAVRMFMEWDKSRARFDLPHFLAWALDDRTPALKLWAVAFAAGLDCTQGVSMAAKAKELRVTRAALSKRVVALSKEYGFQSRNMKKAEARETFRADKLSNHHRYKAASKGEKNNE